MFSHYFQANGDCGHTRNFTWNSGKKRKLKQVHSFCPICSEDLSDKHKFIVKKYLDEVKELI